MTITRKKTKEMTDLTFDHGCPKSSEDFVVFFPLFPCFTFLFFRPPPPFFPFCQHRALTVQPRSFCWFHDKCCFRFDLHLVKEPDYDHMCFGYPLIAAEKVFQGKAALCLPCCRSMLSTKGALEPDRLCRRCVQRNVFQQAFYF